MGASLVHDVDMPAIDLEAMGDRAALLEEMRRLQADHWIVRNPLGYTILRYEDVVAMLRDKRWHSATSRILEMSGITDPQYLQRRRTSILAAEGDEHTRLRRLVGKAFSPRAADRLRPFMRDVINGLVDPVAPTGHADVAIDICEPYPIPIICELLGAPKEDWKDFSCCGSSTATSTRTCRSSPPPRTSSTSTPAG
jgi:cytochrome P450